QLKKFGFRFFFSEGRETVDDVVELGASRYLGTPAYQLDRGIFENFLAQHVQSLGIRFIDGAAITAFTLANKEHDPSAAPKGQLSGSADVGATPDAAERATLPVHEVCYLRDGTEHRLTARWLIDASGRAGLIKRKLDLAEPNAHDANAIWFRIGTRIDI